MKIKFKFGYVFASSMLLSVAAFGFVFHGLNYSALASGNAEGEMFLGLTVAPEDRCSDCSRREYHCPASIEQKIVDRQGGIFGPYEMRYFGSIKETDIEHIVAAAEAHDSGLCARSRDDRKAFAQDLDNLTLASPKVNRWQKSDRDAAEWMPDHNRCWYAGRIIAAKKKWDLSIDQFEKDALEAHVAKCLEGWSMGFPDG